MAQSVRINQTELLELVRKTIFLIRTKSPCSLRHLCGHKTENLETE